MKVSGDLKKILLVDEDDRLRSGCCNELARRGYTAVEVSVGKDALDRLLRERFDLVVLEVDLADVDGMTLYLSAAKVNPEVRKEAFLFTTSSEKLTYTLSRTSLNYKKKPFTPHELVDHVDLLLRGAHPDRGLAQDLPETGEKRGERRLPWDEACMLIPASGDSIPIRAAATEDISCSGLRVRYAGGPFIAPGTNVMVEIRSLKVKYPARVVWSVGSHGASTASGLRFFNQIQPSSLATVLTGR